MEQVINVKLVKSSDFKQIYAIMAIGGHSQYDFRLSFVNENIKYKEDGSLSEITRVIDAEVIMSPRTAKEMSNWLLGHIKTYEQSFGEINVGVLNKKNNVERKPLNFTSEVA